MSLGCLVSKVFHCFIASRQADILSRACHSEHLWRNKIRGLPCPNAPATQLLSEHLRWLFLLRSSFVLDILHMKL